MSSVPGAQLLAEGPQDVWLTGDPQLSFFRSVHKSHVPFGIDIKKMNFDNDGSCRIDRYGDLLGPCYLTAHDTLTGQLVPMNSWAGLFECVDLIIGGQLIDSQDYTYSSQVWPVLESTNWSQSSVPGTFYPLHFFFCQDWSRAIPLVALEFHDVVIRIRGASRAYQFLLWSMRMHLSEHERAWFKSQTHRLLVTSVQRTRITPDQNEFQRFSGMIKYVATPVLNYQGLYNPISISSPNLLDTTIDRTLTASYYNPYKQTIQWSWTTPLPSGVTVTQQTNTQLVFTIAAGTLLPPTALNITVTIIGS